MKFSSSLKLEWKELERFDKSSDEDRSIVFYVENEHYTIYLKSLIETLVNEYGLKVSYVTSSKTDPLLKSTNKNISSFYIGDGIVRTKFFINLSGASTSLALMKIILLVIVTKSWVCVAILVPSC